MFRRFAACLIIAIPLSGCGGGDGVAIYHLSGTVTFDGQPVAYGTVTFHPDEEQQNSGPLGSADIVDGKYDTSLEGNRGTVGGPHIIKFTAYTQAPSEVEDETADVEEIKPIFAEFPINEDLPKETGTKDFTIPSDAEGYDGAKASAARSDA